MRGTVCGNIGNIYKAEYVGDAFLLSFSVAEECWRGSGKGDLTTWHTCEWWGKRAAAAAKHLEVGMHVDVFGQSYLDEYESRGVKKQKLMVDVKDVVFKPKPQGQVGDYRSGASRAPEAEPTPRPARQAPVTQDLGDW